MNDSLHDQARALLAQIGTDKDTDSQPWLQTHLSECAQCRAYRAALDRTILALRSQPLVADAALVRSTLMRVQARAAELRRRRERNLMVCFSCVFVGLSAAITTPLLWRGLEWMGTSAGVSSWVWQAVFAFLWIVPALGVSAVLLARGTYLSYEDESPWR
jgi:predicted anti-sigma-YlaC factor YlaD